MNALQRFAAKVFFGFNSPYEGANISPRRARVPGSGPRDAHLDLTPAVRSELVRRGRYLAKNSGFVRELVNSMALYSVGGGLRPQAESVNPEWNRQAEAYFNRWARKAELSGRFNLSECEHLVCKAIDLDGEIFILKTYREGRPVIQLIESHRVGDNGESGMVDGIKLNKLGIPTAYSVLTDDGQPRLIPADSVLHIFAPDTPTQMRGFPSLQHSINHLLDEAELLALEKHAVKDNADITRVLTTAREDVEESDFKLGAPPIPEKSDPNWLQRILGGKLVKVQPGEDIRSFESARPSPTFTGFLEHLRRDSALGMLPYEFAADSSKLAGAGVRLTVAKADRVFSRRQDLLIDRMLRPLWHWVIGLAITEGKLPAAKNWTEVNFTTPRRITVDSGRESAQNREDVKAGLKTLSDHYAELGMDVHEEIENRAREMVLIRETAAKYNLAPETLYASFYGTAGAAPVEDSDKEKKGKDEEEEEDPFDSVAT